MTQNKDRNRKKTHMKRVAPQQQPEPIFPFPMVRESAPGIGVVGPFDQASLLLTLTQATSREEMWQPFIGASMRSQAADGLPMYCRVLAGPRLEAVSLGSPPAAEVCQRIVDAGLLAFLSREKGPDPLKYWNAADVWRCATGSKVGGSGSLRGAPSFEQAISQSEERWEHKFGRFPPNIPPSEHMAAKGRAHRDRLFNLARSVLTTQLTPERIRDLNAQDQVAMVSSDSDTSVSTMMWAAEFARSGQLLCPSLRTPGFSLWRVSRAAAEWLAELIVPNIYRGVAAPLDVAKPGVIVVYEGGISYRTLAPADALNSATGNGS